MGGLWVVPEVEPSALYEWDQTLMAPSIMRPRPQWAPGNLTYKSEQFTAEQKVAGGSF